MKERDSGSFFSSFFLSLSFKCYFFLSYILPLLARGLGVWLVEFIPIYDGVRVFLNVGVSRANVVALSDDQILLMSA